MNRRTALKTLGAGWTSLHGLNTGAGPVSATIADEINTGDEPKRTWVARDIHRAFGEYECSQSTSVHWFGSGWVDSEAEEFHDFAIATISKCEYQDDYWMDGDAREIVQTEFELTVNDPDDMTVLAQNNPEYIGVWPASGQDIPGWTDTLIDVCLGALHPSLGVALGLDDIVDAFAVKDGFDYIDEGVRYTFSPRESCFWASWTASRAK